VTNIAGALREDLYALMIVSRLILRMKNVSDKSCRENQNARFMFINFIFLKIVPFMR
jgi:hypothetical protein